MRAVKNAAPLRIAPVGLIMLGAGLFGCAGGDPMGPVEQGEPQAATPETAGMQQALTAQQVAGATAVATTILEPLLDGAAALPLGLQIDQGIANLQKHFGSECTAVTQETNFTDGNVTIDYTNCTGPFGALEFSGSSSADYVVDPTTATTSLVLVNDLVVAVGGEMLEATSTMSTDIDILGQAAVVSTILEVTGPDGETHVQEGTLDLTVSGTCVAATLGGDSPTQQTHIEIQDVTFCADGTACVYGAVVRGPERELTVDFHPGGGSFVSFSGPLAGMQEGSLPVDAELCVDLI